MLSAGPTEDFPSTPEPDLDAGQKVGEYVVEEKIGEGGFGTVFRAVHPLIGKQVAIKVLARRFSSDPEMLSRFVAEARAVNQIRHRHIIDIFAFGQLEGHDGRAYYVMELLDGVTLDAHLEQVGRMPLEEAVPVLRAIAKALDAAHAKGIAHRDLKPENIFLVREADGSVFPKLLDFGIAKLLGSGGGAMHKTRTGAPIGTPYYMSPEQCRGRDVDHRTDVYAFGCMAYKMLTGMVPFDGDDYMDILLKQLNEEAVPPSTHFSDLPKSVDAGIAWMLKKDPAARPPNLVTAVRALEQAAEESGIAIPRATASQVYATPRSGMRPVSVTPTPASLGNAATVGVGTLPPVDEVLADPPRRSGALYLGILVGALVVGGAVFFVVRGQKQDDKKQTPPVAAAPTNREPELRPALTPDAAVAVAPPAVDAAPLPAFVTINVTGTPPGTEVYGPRGLIGVAPGPIQLERAASGVILTFRADGHVTASQTVTPAEDQDLAVTLTAKDKGGKKTGGKKTGGKKTGTGSNPIIEDPFKQGAGGADRGD
jgi:eukaryotic-like serine/threonine-protein kinase